jgi:hypothetical protein
MHASAVTGTLVRRSDPFGTGVYPRAGFGGPHAQIAEVISPSFWITAWMGT